MAKKGINPVVAGVAGAAVGAMAGAALADKETRDRGKATLHQIRKAAKKTNGRSKKH